MGVSTWFVDLFHRVSSHGTSNSCSAVGGCKGARRGGDARQLAVLELVGGPQPFATP